MAEVNINKWGLMNIQADKLAKQRLGQAMINNESLPNIHPITNSIPAIFYNNYSNNHYANTMIYSHAAKAIKQLIAKDRSIKYWSQHNHNIQHRYINQESFFHAASNVPHWQKRWLTKWNSGICGVGKWLCRWREQPHSKCPRCQTDNKTVKHVIRCQHEDASLVWSTGLDELGEWMYSHDAAPGIREIFTCRLCQWRDQSDYDDIPDMDYSLQDALTQQDRIGWDNLCFGLVGKRW